MGVLAVGAGLEVQAGQRLGCFLRLALLVAAWTCPWQSGGGSELIFDLFRKYDLLVLVTDGERRG